LDPAQGLAAAADEVAGGRAAGFEVGGGVFGVAVQGVGDVLAPAAGGEVADVVVVEAEDGQAFVGWQFAEEGGEGVQYFVHGAGVVHVVIFDVGDDGDFGVEAEKGAVAFVGFGDEPFAAAEFGVAVEVVDVAADDDGGVEAGFFEHEGDHGGGGGLAVGAGNGDAAPLVHEGGDHFGTVVYGQALRLGGGDFGVAAGDGGGYDDGFGALDVGGVVADDYFGAELPESPYGVGFGDVGAADGVAFGEQDFGDGAHAGAAYADEVDAAEVVEHGCLPFLA
jgi:hypothetical protein